MAIKATGTITLAQVDDGSSGLNQAAISLYQRKAGTAPVLTDIASSLTYTFATGVLSGTLGAWSRTIPVGSNPLYITTAAVIANTPTGTIARAGWSTPVLMAKDGEDGNLYRVETSHPEVLVYVTNESTGLPSYQYSPEKLALKIYSQGTLLGNTGYSLELHTLNDDGQWANFAAELSNTSRYGNVWVFTSATSTWTFDINTFMGLNLPSISGVPALITNLQSNFKNEVPFLIILKVDNIEKVTVPIVVRTPIGDDLATFVSHARGITAAVRNSKLDFSENGLRVYGTGLQIYKTLSDNDPAFYADVDGNLVLKGIIHASGGTFTGELSGATGNFSGEITATKATLFEADVRGKVSVNGIEIVGFNNENPGYISSSNFNSGSDGFKLFASGLIDATDLKLSGRALVDGYLRLGEAWILNPAIMGTGFIPSETRIESHLTPNDFIVVNKRVSTNVTNLLKISSLGRITLGSAQGITLDAESQSIFTNNFSSGQGWSISPDSAVFNNITVRGSIKTSVFEYSRVQAVGGILVVRPSSIIKEARKVGDNILVKVENRTGIESDGWAKVQLGDSALTSNVYLVQLSVPPSFDTDGSNPTSGEDGAEITLVNAGIDNTAESFKGAPLIFLGKQDDIGIGINSSTNDSFVTPRSLSLFATQVSGSTVSLATKLILGEIPNDDKYGVLKGSYGLYAENVLVKGSLVSEGTLAYSGISSDSIYDHTVGDSSLNLLKTDSKILIWAGATSANAVDVAAAPFKVYQDGSFVATKGYFTGSIITDAEIKAATIHTAEIIGYGQDSGVPALKIKDANTGIAFYHGNDVKMSLGNDGLKLQIDFNIADKIKAFDTGNLIMAPYFLGYKDNTVGTFLSHLRLGFTDAPPIPHRGLEPAANLGYIIYNKDETSEGIEIFSKGMKTATFGRTINTFHGNVKIQRDLILNTIIEYKLATDIGGNPIGYDVYVR